jgi:hypothetical protein
VRMGLKGRMCGGASTGRVTEISRRAHTHTHTQTHTHTHTHAPLSQTSTRILGLDSDRLTRLSLIAALTAEEGRRRVYVHSAPTPDITDLLPRTILSVLMKEQQDCVRLYRHTVQISREV